MDTLSVHRSAERNALERVLASEEFSRSERLSSFLSYVCEATLERKNLRLTEQHLGIHVFGRPDNYIPADDTIVRTTAAMLRKRLAKYYETEGHTDPLRIAIPRGAYTPVFVANEAALPVIPDASQLSETPPEVEPTSTTNASIPGWRLRTWIYAAGAAVVLLLAIVALALVPSLQRQDPVDVFWKSLLFSNRETLMVPADSELVMYQRAIGREVALGDYIAKRFVTPDTKKGPVGDSRPEFRWRRYTGVISVNLAAELGRLSAGAPQRLRVRYARDMQLNDLKHANAVLVGISEANPWVGLFRERLNYHIDWDTRTNSLLVRNDKPAHGEQSLYEFSGVDSAKHGFAVLAYTANLSGDGNVLMVGGTSSVGTEAAIDFLLNREQMRAVLLRALRSDGSVGQFEILLQCVLKASGSTEVKVLGVRTQEG